MSHRGTARDLPAVLEAKPAEPQFLGLKDIVIGWADEVVSVRLVPIDGPFWQRFAVRPLIVHVQIALEPAFFGAGHRTMCRVRRMGTNNGRGSNGSAGLQKFTSSGSVGHGVCSLEILAGEVSIVGCAVGEINQ